MRFIAFPLLLVLSCNTKPQSVPKESLQKYSYYIFGETDSTYLSGSGFFIRNANKIFFVTARHVLLGCNNKLQKAKNIPDIITVSFVTSLNKADTVLVVNIRNVKRKHDCYPAWQILDAEVLEIPFLNEENSKHINSVESFIGEPLKMKGEIQIYGYPTKPNQSIPWQYNHNPASSISIPNTATLTFPTQLPEINQIDSANYRITDKSQQFLQEDVKGFSGSPVFMRNEVTNKWQIIGLLSGGGPNSIVVPAIHHIIKQAY